MFSAVYSTLSSLYESSTWSGRPYSVGIYRIGAWVTIIFYLAIYLLFYVFLTLTSYRILARHNAGKKWMAFIPFVQLYAIILTSKQETFMKMTKKSFGILLIVFGYVYYSINILNNIFYEGGVPIIRFLTTSGDESLKHLTYILSVKDITEIYPYFGLDLWTMVFGVAYVVFMFVFALSYFRYRTPSFKALAILFGIFFRPVLPFLLFAFRNREEKDHKMRFMVISEENFTNYQSENEKQGQPFADYSNKPEEPFAEFSTKQEEPFSEFNTQQTDNAQENGVQSEDKGGDDLFD